MFYYLPAFYPPTATTPTHQLVYVPPTPSNGVPLTSTINPPHILPPTPTSSISPTRPTPPFLPTIMTSPTGTMATDHNQMQSHSPPGSHDRYGSSELADDHRCVLRKYELIMRQEPVQARMCGVGEKCESMVPQLFFLPSSSPVYVKGTLKADASFAADRRPVDPTPIVQLKVIDDNGNNMTTHDHSDPTSELRRPDPSPTGMTFMQSE